MQRIGKILWAIFRKEIKQSENLRFRKFLENVQKYTENVKIYIFQCGFRRNAHTFPLVIIKWTFPESFSKIGLFFAYLWTENLVFGRFRVSGPKNRKTGFFGKNRAMSLFSPYSGLTSCKESEKSLEPFSGKRSKSLKNLVFGPFSGLRGR